jgi:hypothetical protein
MRENVPRSCIRRAWNFSAESGAGGDAPEKKKGDISLMSGGVSHCVFSAGLFKNKNLLTKSKSAIELSIELSTLTNTHHHVGNNSTSPLRM